MCVYSSATTSSAQRKRTRLERSVLKTKGNPRLLHYMRLTALIGLTSVVVGTFLLVENVVCRNKSKRIETISKNKLKLCVEEKL